MKHIILSLAFACGLSLYLHAQEKTFTVKAGQSINNVLSFNEIYAYPAFSQGMVYYTDNTKAPSTLNYNIILGKMQYIDDQKDTLVITNSDIIDSIVLKNDTYYVSNDNYFQKLSGNNNIKLLLNRYTKFKDIKKEGPYGSSSSMAATEEYTSFFTNSQSQTGGNNRTINLKVNQDMVFAIESDYYFKIGKNELLPVRKRTLLKMFPEQSDLIKQFIKTNSIKFNKESDLIKLTSYIDNLQ